MPKRPRDPTASLAAAELTDADLESRLAEVHAHSTEREILFATARAGGASIAEAARQVGVSGKGGAPYKFGSSPRVAELLTLMREQARRRAMLTVEKQITRLQALGRKAEEKGDLSAAIAAEREASKLGGLYPEQRITLTVDQSRSTLGPVTPEDVEAVALLREHRRAQLQAGTFVDATFTPAEPSSSLRTEGVTTPARPMAADPSEAPEVATEGSKSLLEELFS